MKAILTGATGTIGGETLRQLLAHPDITSIVVLSRRELPESLTGKDAKVRTVIMKEDKDWTAWSDNTRQAVEGADFAIWSVGSKLNSDLKLEALHRVEVEWPLHLAKEMAASPRPTARPFRFVYVSGALSAKKDASTWFLGALRKLKGEAETALETLAKEQSTTLSATVVRPACVYPKEKSGFGGVISYIGMSVGVDELAAAMIRIATEEGTGGTGKVSRVMENAELVSEGRRALSKK